MGEPRLRDYQKAAVDAAIAALRGFHDSAAIVLPTGTGKTQVAGGICKEWGGSVLFVAPRGELVLQACRTFERFGLRVGVEMAESSCADSLMVPQVVVGTIQTVSQPGRLARMARPSLLIVDEAHHCTRANSTYRAVVEWSGSAKRLGLTATPGRTDGIRLSDWFGHEAYRMTLPDAIENGWLCDARQNWVEIAGLDLNNIKVVAGELSQQQLEEMLLKDETATKIAAETAIRCGRERTLVFTPGVASAKAVTTALISMGIRAASLDGTSTREHRTQVLSAYEDGEYTCLVGAMLFTEGFDSPGIRHIVNARPVKSKLLYTQIVGRGLRPLASAAEALNDANGPDGRRHVLALSGKPWCNIWDLTGASTRHDLCQLADLFEGTASDEAIAAVKVKKAGTDAGGQSVSEQLKTAQQELDAAEQRRNSRRATVYVPTISTTTAVPLSGMPGVAMPSEYAGQAGSYTCTDRQADALRRMGQDPTGHSKGSASKLMDSLIAERDAAPPSHAQSVRLRSLGLLVTDFTRGQATAAIEVANALGNLPDLGRSDISIRKGDDGFLRAVVRGVLLERKFRSADEVRKHYAFLIGQEAGAA